MSNRYSPDSLRRRAAKVQAESTLVEQFIALGKEKNALIRVVNGNSLRWRKDGNVGVFSEITDEKNLYISYELTVKTVWSGGDYTIVTKIEKITQDFRTADSKFHQSEIVAKHEHFVKWKSPYASQDRAVILPPGV